MKLGDRVVCVDSVGLDPKLKIVAGTAGTVASILEIPGEATYLTFLPDLHEGGFLMRASRFHKEGADEVLN